MTMCSTGFWPALFPVGGVPAVQTPEQVASPTFLKGYPVVRAAGLIDECGALPLLILGVALQDNQTNPGFAAANSPTTITGRSNTASVAIANNVTQFIGFLVNNSATIVAPVAADLDVQYGISKQTGGWRVDKSLLGADARVVITRIDTTNNFVYFKFLAAYQQDASV